MALFQPSHVVPSALSGLGNGVVAVSSDVSVSWQVNGNSAMTAFQIDIYTNNAASTLVHSTGIISSGYGLPFYGTDSKGNQQTFVYDPSVTWSSLGLSDGNSYKLKITQYWNGTSQSVEQYSESAFITRAPAVLTMLNFSATVSTVSNTFSASYSQSQGDAVNWVRWQLQDITDSGEIDIDDTGAINTAVLQYSYDGFLTGRTYRIKASIETQSGATATTGWKSFTVSYSEASANGDIYLQYDSENECALLSWQKGANIPGTATPPNGALLSPANDLVISRSANITWDTVDGEPMNFAPEYSAYWRGRVSPCFVMTQSLNDNTSKTYEVTCSALSPDENTLYLGANTTIGENYSGALFVYKRSSEGRFSISNTISVATPIYTISCSPDGDTFVIGGESFGEFYDASTLQRIAFIISALNGTVYTSAYSPAGNFFVIGGTMGGYAEIHTINGKELVGWENITMGGALNGKVTSCAFVDGGNTLLLGGEFTSYCKAYTVSGTTLTFKENLTTDGAAELSGSVTAIAAAGANRDKFIVCGNFSDKSYIYEITNGTFAKTMSITFPGTAYAAAWSPTADRIAFAGTLGTASQYGALMYCFHNGTPYQMALIPDGLRPSIPLESLGKTCLFTADGASFVVGGDFPSGATIYNVNNDTANLILFGNSLSVEYRYGMLFANANGTIVSVPLTSNPNLTYALVGFIPNGVSVYNLNSSGSLITLSRISVAYAQPSISFVTLNGPQENTFTYIAEGIVEFLGSYVPTRDFNTLFYTDYSTAGLQAGTIAGGTSKNALYRTSEGGSVMASVYKFPSSVKRIRDFGIKSNTRYYWEMFYVSTGDQYSTSLVSSSFCRQFGAFTLIEATEDSQYPNVYHALRVWRFASNVTGWSVSNNNTPNLLPNFTKYPYRQASTQNYKSGILQGLLSNPKNGVYQDNAKQMELLFSISQSLNTFFLRDIKGNLYMVHTNGPITQNMSTTSSRNEITVSVPWAEVGDASNVSIIQTPEDEGWKNNEVLNVSMSVNVKEGTANASYHENYIGTTFASNNFDMIVKTSTTMEQPDLEVTNGDLYATL